MRIVVVGGSGNVGTAVLRRLAADPGVTSLGGVARRTPTGEPYDGVDWLTTDIGTPYAAEELAPFFAGADAVIHLAWAIQPSHRRALLRRTNVGGTANVVTAVLRAGVPTFVQASSVGAYAPVASKDTLVDERWPTTGIHRSSYSVDKAAVEAMLDRAERPALRIVRLRPGLVFQRAAGAEIGRYFLGPLVPTPLLASGRLPLVPDVPGFRVQAVHADDLADAYARAALTPTAHGAYNVAADPVLDAGVVAREFGGRTVPVPYPLVWTGALASWAARLQPTDPGWVSLGAGAPLMDTSRIRDELGWQPAHDGVQALRELIGGLADGAGTGSPVLRPRDPVHRRVRQGLPGHAPQY